MSQNEVPGWKRMRFKGNKVWMELDDSGRPAVADKKVRIKYQLDQSHEYRVSPKSLTELDQEPQENRKKKPRTGSAKPAGKTRGPDARKEETTAGRNAVVIYTDGAASGNPGPSGIGAVLRYGGKTKEISKYIGIATNNVAELEAVRAALSALKRKDLPVRLYTDSSYVHGLLVLGWQAKKNPELVEKVRDLVRQFKDIEIVKVRGHDGIADNEQADFLATSAIKNQAGGK
ncbi:MAG: ribonuclease HI [Desulfobacterales bacterium]|nr:ribonuclease HI [Desulfobacterales bacterium]MBS3754124.1 ribonuclease HI [Desulfobacterales bacterium]